MKLKIVLETHAGTELLVWPISPNRILKFCDKWRGNVPIYELGVYEDGAGNTLDVTSFEVEGMRPYQRKGQWYGTSEFVSEIE